MTVRYTLRALADLDAAREHIEQFNPRAARLLAGRLRAAIDELSRFPARGRLGRLEGTRELVVPRTPYLVAYRTDGPHIDILAIRHGARLWPAALE